MKLNFHVDGGHGWLEVPRAELSALGLEARVSEYSYLSVDGSVAYLEEDCDAPLFIEAFNATRFTYPAYQYVEHTGLCFIRALKRFKAGAK